MAEPEENRSDEVDELIGDLEAHGADTGLEPYEGTDGCTGGDNCTNGCTNGCAY